VSSQLWVYPLNGNGVPFRLLGGEAVETDAQFSPDGRWLAFTSNETGRAEVYVVPFDPKSNVGQGRTALRGKLQISTLGGHWPRWNRQGGELFYMTANNTLMSVRLLRRASVFHIGPEHPLFRINPGYYNTSYDVAPDASRFIVNTAPQERTAPITLVGNWLSDFKN